jgi:hypothetical protein
MEALRQTAGIKGNSKKALSAIKQMVFTSDQEKQKIKEEARKAITAIEDKTQVKIGVLWPPHGGLTNLGNRAGTTKSAIMAALADVHKQVGQEAPEEIWV